MKNLKRIRTWMYEALFVALFLFCSLLYKDFEITEVICSFAVFATFLYGQVSDRMQEKQSEKENPDVECYKWSNRYYISKEIMWILYFFMINSYAALIGAFIFLIYPFWRKLYKNKLNHFL